MQFSQLVLSVLLAGTALAVPSPAENIQERALCTEPNCTAHCPDGTPYDNCVVYIRDPCTDHRTKCTDIDCICDCPNCAGTFLCNVDYFRDPCADLASAA